MDILTVLEAARAPLTLSEIREYSGLMFSEERLESLLRSGDIKEVPGLTKVYWSVPLALRRRPNSRRCQSPLRSEERRKEIDSIVSLRSKLVTITEQLEVLEVRKDEMATPEQLKAHRERLHRFNFNKDIGQQLIGILAEMDRVKSKDIYERYDLSMEE